MDIEIIKQVQEKLKVKSLRGVERHFKFPYNTLSNVKYGLRPIPIAHKKVLINFLTDQDTTKVDNWEKSKNTIRKGVYPKWVLKIKTYCLEKQITVDELIKTHRTIHG